MKARLLHDGNQCFPDVRIKWIKFLGDIFQKRFLFPLYDIVPKLSGRDGNVASFHSFDMEMILLLFIKAHVNLGLISADIKIRVSSFLFEDAFEKVVTPARDISDSDVIKRKDDDIRKHLLDHRLSFLE